ncbi:MAG: hypothetical protein KF819_27000 [Labilithrix sp.]|nr:hypothetical protein [Labilithrix sp.]
MRRARLTLALALAWGAGAAALVACGSFGSAGEAAPDAADDDARRDDLEAGGDAGLTDAPSPEGSADAGTVFATFPTPIQALACGPGPSPIYVALETEIRTVRKADGVIESVVIPHAARHVQIDNPVVFASGDTVRRGALGVQLVATQNGGVGGVATTPNPAGGVVYYSSLANHSIRVVDGVNPPSDFGLTVLPAEGLLVRAGSLYAAVPEANRVIVFSLDGGAQTGAVNTGDVYALASSATHLYWVAKSTRAIRFAPWVKLDEIGVLVPPSAGTEPMQAICADPEYLYFGVGTQLRRVPLR